MQQFWAESSSILVFICFLMRAPDCHRFACNHRSNRCTPRSKWERTIGNEWKASGMAAPSEGHQWDDSPTCQGGRPGLAFPLWLFFFFLSSFSTSRENGSFNSVGVPIPCLSALTSYKLMRSNGRNVLSHVYYCGRSFISNIKMLLARFECSPTLLKFPRIAVVLS